MDATDGHGADVILDIVGAAYLARNIAALAPDGRIANIGMQQGRKAELDFGALMAKRGTISSTTLRARPRGAEGEHRRGGHASTSGRSSRQARSAPSSTGSCR